MEQGLAIFNWIMTHWVEILKIWLEIAGAASAIVAITPTLKDDNAVLPIIKFIGKWLAMNKTVLDSDRPK